MTTNRLSSTLRDGLVLSKRLGNRVQGFNLMRNLGWLHIYTGTYNKALEALYESQDRHQDENLTYQATILTYLGATYVQHGDFERAKFSLDKALHGFRKTRPTRAHRTVALHWLSLLHIYREDYDSALNYAQEAFRNAEVRHDGRHAAAAKTYLGHAYLGKGETNEATESYQEAIRLHREMGQINRSMEPLAGMANAALSTCDTERAMEYTDEILSHIENNNLDRTEEAFKVYDVCYRLLIELNDSRAETVCQRAYDQLQLRASSLNDEEQLRLFWSMRGHQEIVDAIEAANL